MGWQPFSRRYFQMHFLEWKLWISVEISLKFVPKCPISNIPALLGADQATIHYLNKWWLVYWRIYASLGLNELISILNVCIRIYATANYPSPILVKQFHLILLHTESVKHTRYSPCTLRYSCMLRGQYVEFETSHVLFTGAWMKVLCITTVFVCDTMLLIADFSCVILSYFAKWVGNQCSCIIPIRGTSENALASSLFLLVARAGLRPRHNAACLWFP